jgi:hypothetical protein
MGMLKRDSQLLLILIIALLFVACKYNKNNEEMIKVLNVLSNSKECCTIRAIAKDTLTLWIKEKLNNRSCEDTISYGKSWIIDSTVAFNFKRDRVVMGVLYSSNNTPTTVMDEISFLYGAKIECKWYFFHGGTIHLPREIYVSMNKIHEPLSFTKLHEIAMKEVFGGYLVKNTKGKWVINEAWFKQQFEGTGWGDFNDQDSEDWFLKGKRFKTEKEYYEFAYLQKVRNNWCWKNK